MEEEIPSGSVHVRIAHSLAANCIVEARALREVLEILGYRVSIYSLKHRRDINTFLQTVLPEGEFTVICCHGSGSSRTGAYLLLETIEYIDEEWKTREFWIRGGDVATLIPKGSGTLISTGCHTGRASIGEAMIKAGFSHYIAPDNFPMSKSGMLFILNFFYLLKRHEHDVTQYARTYSIPEAARLAARIDGMEDPHGASAFVCYPLIAEKG